MGCDSVESTGDDSGIPDFDMDRVGHIRASEQ